MKKPALLATFAAFALSLLPASAIAYNLNGPSWSNASTNFHTNVTQAPHSNANWQSAFVEAMNAWNNSTNFTFNPVSGSAEPCGSGGGNGAEFDFSFCGSSFGSSTLAVAQWWYNGSNNLTKTGIVFNKQNWNWSVYSGSWNGIADFRRVAVHELGHALGLGHSNATAIMRPTVSNIEVPQADDIAGVNALYPEPSGGGGQPTNTAPTVTSQIANRSVQQGASNATIDLYGVFADAQDSDAQLSFSVTGNSNGSVVAASISSDRNLNLVYGSPGTSTVTVRATDSGGLWVQDSFNVTVNGTTANSAPTVTTPMVDITAQVNASTRWYDLFPVFGDSQDSDSAMSFSISSNSNPGMFTSVRVRSDRWLRINYSRTGQGVADITVRATDTGGLFVEDTINVTVGNPEPDPPVATNQPPTVASPISNVTVNEDAASTVMNISAVFTDTEDGTSLTRTVQSNTNAGLVSASMSGSNLTLVYAANASGSSNVTIRATDSGGLSVDDTFAVTVNAQNDPPTVVSPIADVTVEEGAADTQMTLNGKFQDPEDGSALAHTMEANTNPSVVTPSISGSTLILAYTGSSGTADITIKATDSGGLSVDDIFTVTVNAAGDPGNPGGTDPAPEDPGPTSDIGPMIAVGLGATAGQGNVELLDPAAAFASTGRQTADGSYSGETRPAWCDVDGDGNHELVLGLGEGGGGRLEVKDGPDGGYAHLTWLQIDWADYNNANGETWPACGDVDGDGKDEIVVGLGEGGSGLVFVFDDAAAGYTPHIDAPNGDGWLQLPWSSYSSSVGEVRPAVGNLDADPAEEIVMGLESGGLGWTNIRDDSASGFGPMSTRSGNGWLYIGWRSYGNSNGETWPAVCDLNGDGAGEVILGLGEGGSGWARAFNSATNFGTLSGTASSRGWFRLGWTEYNSAVGVVYPACGDIDNDGKDELLLGQASYQPGGRIEVRDDVGAGMAQIDWGQVEWDAYNSADGLTRPALAR